MSQENIHSFPGFAKGKLKPLERDSIKFGQFLKMLPTAPLVDIAPNYAYPIDGNDQVGCCVVAGWDHLRQVVTGLLTGTPQNFTQDQLWAFYRTQNPDFDPNGTADTNGPGSSSDNGMNIQLFLEWLQTNGYILGFSKIDQTNELQMKAAVYLGLGIITGVVLDQIQMAQFDNGYWDNIPGSPVDGGHCIPIVGYTGTPDYITCVTWGKLLNCTQPFVLKQMDEAWFVLMQEHVNHPEFRNHFDLAGFSQAVNEITGGKISIPVPPVPTSNFTKNKFLSFYVNTPYYNSAETCFDAISIALAQAGILSDMTLIGALATARVEVGRMYIPVRENISQTTANADYNGILGNIPGTNDGYFFRGGGLPQLTGRENYQKYGLVNNPDNILDLGTSARVLVQFFKDHGIDTDCNNKDWTTVREKFNGGTNGLGLFLSIIGQFLNVL